MGAMMKGMSIQHFLTVAEQVTVDVSLYTYLSITQRVFPGMKCATFFMPTNKDLIFKNPRA